ncbi:MAG: transposase, partial [Kiritimatiellia bacterium]
MTWRNKIAYAQVRGMAVRVGKPDRRPSRPAAKEHGRALATWIKSTQRCRIPAFVELQQKIRKHEKHVPNTIEFGLSNARIETINNKIKLLIRIAYGFRDIDAMISLVMLFCSSIEIPRPGNKSIPCKQGLNDIFPVSQKCHRLFQVPRGQEMFSDRRNFWG